MFRILTEIRHAGRMVRKLHMASILYINSVHNGATSLRRSVAA